VTTETELVNAALRKVGAKRITDISDSVGPAGVASDVIATERDELLRLVNWNFATTRANLAPLATTPIYEFQYAFTIPSDCVRLIAVHDNDAGDGAVEYKREAVQQSDGSYINCILCAANEIWIKYVRRVTEPSDWDYAFRQVLVLRLAKIFAVSLVKSNALYQAITAEHDRAFRDAASADGIEDYPDKLEEGSWARSRRRWTRNASGTDPWNF
jgi:hypothetical protein